MIGCSPNQSIIPIRLIALAPFWLSLTLFSSSVLSPMIIIFRQEDRVHGDTNSKNDETSSAADPVPKVTTLG